MTDNIFQLINKVMISVGAVRKAERNTYQNFNFRGIDAVINAISPALREHGVIIAPSVVDVQYTDVASNRGGVMNRCVVTVDYTLYGPAGDSFTTRSIGEAFDSGDKATAKAMSVAMRTAILQTFALPTDEQDPDSHSPEGTPGQARAMRAAQHQGQPPAQGQAQAQGGFDPQHELQIRWHDSGQLANFRQWIKDKNPPAGYVEAIDARITELSNQGE